MDKIVIQKDESYIRKLEDFLASLCYDNHLDKYHAAISVPVMNIIQFAFDDSQSGSDFVTLKCGYCKEGLFFKVTASCNCFQSVLSNIHSTPALSPLPIALVQMLSDEVSVLDEGRTVQLIFHLAGIPMREMYRRMEVLESFYAPTPNTAVLTTK